MRAIEHRTPNTVDPTEIDGSGTGLIGHLASLSQGYNVISLA
jgi:hypothetical protein